MQYPILDGHADTAQILYLDGLTLLDGKTHITLPRMAQLERYAQFFAYCPIWNKEYSPQELYDQSRRFFLAQLARYGDKITLCGSVTQMEQAWQAKKAAAFFALEGAEAIGCDPGRLEEAHRDGVRMVTLTWNYENPLGGTNVTGGGLTAQGREFVRRAQQLGIIVDVSHASDEVFFHVAEIAEKPFVASHSNCRAVCPHRRNLTDDQIRCLIQTGGTMGLNLWSDAVKEPDGSAPTFDHVRRHLEHVLDLGGENVLALGGDLDGCNDLPVGFTGVDNYNDMMAHLEENGFSPALLNKICAGNLRRVMDACELAPV